MSLVRFASMLERPTAVTQDTADLGCIFVSGPHRDYVLSDAFGWREGNVFVLRSSEFDIMAEDEDFQRAVEVFIAHVIDYAVMLYELVESGDATEEEAEAFRVLSGRLTPLAEATAQPSTQKRRPRRRRGSGSGHWRHRGTQASGSAPLSAA
jgi:hypothetical protein